MFEQPETSVAKVNPGAWLPGMAQSIKRSALSNLDPLKPFPVVGNAFIPSRYKNFLLTCLPKIRSY
jgi:hypothetical protein